MNFSLYGSIAIPTVNIGMLGAVHPREDPSTGRMHDHPFYNVYHVLDERNNVTNNPLKENMHTAFRSVIEDFESFSNRLLKVGVQT